MYGNAWQDIDPAVKIAAFGRGCSEGPKLPEPHPVTLASPMNYWRLLDKARAGTGRIEKAPPEEMHLYSEEAEVEIKDTIRRMGRELMEDWKGSHYPDLWPSLEERVEEMVEERIGRVRLFFFQKRTGHPF